MTAEIDDNLTLDQWEALKAIRIRAPRGREPIRFAVESLIALQLAAIVDDTAVLTPKGRSVLLRGSPRLLDVAA
jgi:hypothetical protein